jgi:uncharacterized DUF497 family protein
VTDKLVFEWDPKKRQKIINERDLDIVILAPELLASPSTKFFLDKRKNYREERWLAFGIVDELRLCLCFTLRNDIVRLITIYKVNSKDWEKNYGKDD